MNITFEPVSLTQIRVMREGVELATIDRVGNTLAWTLVDAGGVLDQGLRSRMQREAIERFCTCEECQNGRSTQQAVGRFAKEA